MKADVLVGARRYVFLGTFVALVTVAWPCGGSCAEVPDTRPTAQGEAQLQERQRLWQESQRLKADGKTGEAVELIKRVLAIDRELAASRPAELADTLERLASLQMLEEDFLAAREAAAECLELRTKLFGDKHYKVTDTRSVLAAVELLGRLTKHQFQELVQATWRFEQVYHLLRRARYAEAVPFAKRALRIHRAILGEQHPRYAVSLNRVGSLYKATGDYAQAEWYYRQALEIRKKALGEEHPAFASSLNDLGLLYENMGDHARAEPHFQQALVIWKKVLGEEHPDYATGLNNLGRLYISMGAYARAERCFDQALEIRKKAQGEEHPDYATSLNDLGLLYESMGDYARAEPHLQQALVIWKKVLGEDHPNYATSLSSLG